MEQTTSEALDGTVNTSNSNLNGGLDNVSDSNNMSPNGDELSSYHLDKKAKVTHARISSFEASSNNTSSADSDMMNSSMCSSDFEAAKILQSLQSSMCPEEASVGRQISTPPNEHFPKMLDGISEYGTSVDDSPSPPASVAFHARYRNSDPSLMTLHIFTGQMNGNKPVYVPVYKRSDSGKLLKLLKNWSGRWEYIEPENWEEEEEEAEELEIFEKPKAEVVLQSSALKKTVGRRTLADFGLPETKKTGGWGWL